MKRDVSADRHDTWGGDAMDAAARETNVAKADGEVVWSCSPALFSSFKERIKRKEIKGFGWKVLAEIRPARMRQAPIGSSSGLR